MGDEYVVRITYYVLRTRAGGSRARRFRGLALAPMSKVVLRRTVILAVSVAVVLAACDNGAGEPDPSSAAPTVVRPTAPPTTVMASLAAEPDGTIDCPNFVRGDESVQDLPSVEEAKLYGPGAKISQFVFTNTTDFGGARVVRNPTRIEVGIKSDINENCWALRDLVTRKATFHVVRVPYSLADVQLAAEAAAARGATTHAVQGQSVRAYLSASGEAVAAELYAEFGDMLDLSVGGWSYPEPQADDDVGLFCQNAASAGRGLPDLRITAESPSEPMYAIGDGWRFAAAGSVEIAITFENTGSEAIAFSLPQATLPLSKDGQLVSVLAGFIDVLQAPSIFLEPGDKTQAIAVVGLSPCSLDDGYSVPAGVYTAELVLSSGSDGVLGRLSEPLSVEVAAATNEPAPAQTVPSVTAPPTTAGG